MAISERRAVEIDGKWTRCDRYEMVDGCVLPGSKDFTEFDPWEAFRNNHGRHRTVIQPYISILELNRKLAHLEQNGISPSSVNARHSGPQNEADKLVIGWCQQNGLLGLLPGLSDSIRLRADGPEFFRIGGVWNVLSGTKGTVGLSWVDLFLHRTACERKKTSALFDYHVPTVKTRKNLVSDMACPLSPKFWPEYCEPAYEIVYWARFFTSMINTISQWRRGTGGHEEAEVRRAHWNLMALASTVAPTFTLQGRYLRQVRFSPSILASYALMFLWDRSDEDRLALQCANCSAFFVSDLQTARFCSGPCRNRAHVRDSTHREKARKEKS